MQITDVKHFLANPGRGKNLCFVKVETDEGIYGWGEAYTQSDRDVQITAHIDQMRRYLIGRDPRNIKHFLQWSYDDFAGRRGAMDFWCAVSGIEHAMWDITGKKAGMPVHMLIGGRVATRYVSMPTAGAVDRRTSSQTALAPSWRWAFRR